LFAVFFLRALEDHAGAEVSGHRLADRAAVQPEPVPLSD
jgi:hypothetical protein